MHDEPDLALADMLKQLREDREITQEQLAFEAGITASALSRIERGVNNPGWMTVRRLTEALNVTLVQLAKAIESDVR
ncbi:MAG TPA: helix-turn-helix transcriptional regulator [Solirubrobacteraceae bacterium]|nr:helix-turn-helix transcriptional regulator [Solirubrobacteraceae bacterium]